MRVFYMTAVIGLLFGLYMLGGVVSVFVFPVRCGAGGSPPLGLGAYLTAVMHPPSRRNGLPWIGRSFVKMYVWPIVLIKWWNEGRPPSPILFGEAAAKKLGMDPSSSEGFATMWTAKS